MKTFLVTRHQGAIDWFANQGLPVDEYIEHFDPSIIQSGDKVIGILPIQLIAEVCAKGGEYYHLKVKVPLRERGKELSAAQLTEFGARLVGFHASFVENN